MNTSSLLKSCDRSNVHRNSSLLSSKYSKPFHKSTALALKNYCHDVPFGFLTKFYLYHEHSFLCYYAAFITRARSLVWILHSRQERLMNLFKTLHA